MAETQKSLSERNRRSGWMERAVDSSLGEEQRRGGRRNGVQYVK